MGKVEKIAAVFFLLFCMNPCVEAQNRHYDIYTSVFMSDFGGHTYNNVVDIYEDNSGFVWLSLFGGGLARYDGSDFMSFRTDTPVPLRNNYVTGVAQDGYNRLWVTSVGGLDVIDMRTFSNDRTVEEVVRANDHLYCSPPICTSDGAIWFSSSNYLHRISFSPNGSIESRDSVRCASSRFDRHMVLSEVDGDGAVWTSLDGFVTKIRYVPGNGFQMTDVNRFLYLGDGNNITCFVRKEDVVWIGTPEGLFSINKSTGDYTSYGRDQLLSTEITSLEVTEDGSIAVGTLSGLNVYNSTYGEFIPYDSSVNEYGNRILANNQIRALKNIGGALWVGTDRDGVSILRRKRLSITNVRHRENDLTSLPDAPIHSIFVDSKGRRWVGTSENGFFLQNEGAISFSGFNSKSSGLIHNSVKSFAEDGQGRIWVGTIGGEVYTMNPENPASISPVPVSGIREPMDDVNGLLYDELNDYMWIATRSGLCYYDMSSRSIVKSQENIRLCSQIVRDAHNTIWIPHMSGIMSINLQTRQMKNYPLNYYPFSVEFDSRGNIWVGGFDNGLFLYDSNLVQKACFTVEDGLSDNRIRGLAFDGAGLWVTTDHGLSRVDVSSNEIISFSVYDGVEPYSFCDNSVFIDKQSHSIYFGHMRGAAALWSTEVPPAPKRDVNLLFTQAYSGSRRTNLAYDDKVQLKQKDKRFTFSFADLSYSDPASVHYYVRLYPFEKEWRRVEGNSRTSRYASLPGGDFKLQVKAEDLNGNLVGEAEKAISVKPYFYRTFLFYLLLLLFLTLCWYYIYRMRTKSLISNQQRLKEEVDKQTKLLSEQKVELEKRAEELAEQNKLLLKQNEALAGHRIVASTEAAVGGTSNRDAKFVDKVMDTIRGLYKDPDLDVMTFCEAIGMSRSVLNNKIQEAFGQSIAQFIRTYRLNVAKEILMNSSHGSINISEVAYEIGFSDPKYFTRCFSKEFGISPSSVLSGTE